MGSAGDPAKADIGAQRGCVEVSRHLIGAMLRSWKGTRVIWENGQGEVCLAFVSSRALLILRNASCLMQSGYREMPFIQYQRQMPS